MIIPRLHYGDFDSVTYFCYKRIDRIIPSLLDWDRGDSVPQFDGFADDLADLEDIFRSDGRTGGQDHALFG